MELIKPKLFCFVFGKKINHQQALLWTLVTLVGGTPRCTDNVPGHGLLLGIKLYMKRVALVYTVYEE